jgi:hypothetical protein
MSSQGNIGTVEGSVTTIIERCRLKASFKSVDETGTSIIAIFNGSILDVYFPMSVTSKRNLHVLNPQKP